MRVLGVQEPLRVGVGAALEHLARELGAEAAPAVGREDVDVGKVEQLRREPRGPAEADLPPVVVEPDDPCRLAYELLLHRELATGRPVGLLGEESLHLGHVDPLGVVVELESVAEVAPHAAAAFERSR